MRSILVSLEYFKSLQKSCTVADVLVIAIFLSLRVRSLCHQARLPACFGQNNQSAPSLALSILFRKCPWICTLIEYGRDRKVEVLLSYLRLAVYDAINFRSASQCPARYGYT